MAPNPLHLSLDQLQQLADDATKNREALESAADEASRTSQRTAIPSPFSFLSQQLFSSKKTLT